VDKRPVIFGVFIYDGTEPIDLATFGVLSMARRIEPAITIHTISSKAGITTLTNGLRVVADFDIGSAPRVDVLIVTGGPGWTEQAKAPEVLEFIRRNAHETLLVSVCTGSMLLAASGVIDGKSATTKHEIVPPEISPAKIMRETYRQVDVRHSSLVAYDRIITGGGVTLCIDTMIYVIEKLFGRPVADETARILEYSRARAANLQHFPAVTIVDGCKPQASSLDSSSSAL
jgi:transcriptional regulator GlxA family with amidase domain